MIPRTIDDGTIRFLSKIVKKPIENVGSSKDLESLAKYVIAINITPETISYQTMRDNTPTMLATGRETIDISIRCQNHSDEIIQKFLNAILDQR